MWVGNPASIYNNTFYLESLTSSGGSTNLLTIKNNGNVGIGTTSPVNKFEILATQATQTLIYNFTGSSQNFVVPAGVTQVTIKAWGAGGGGGYPPTNGGGGGYVSGVLTTTPGETLTIVVGGGGSSTGSASLGGYGGGGNGGTSNSAIIGGGGGRSEISGNGGVLTAGGGGGGAGSAGGAGGGVSGGGSTCGSTGGSGGVGGISGNCGVGSGNNGGVTNGGNGGDRPSGGGGGGGGGGYGGGGGGAPSSEGGAGGGGRTVAGGSNTAGSGATPGNNSDSDRGTAGNGGSMGVSGNPGRVIITYSNALSHFVYTNNGKVGIGTTSPSYQLQLSTDSAAKPGTNTWTIASDARIKTNIHPFTDGLSVIDNIDPIWYQYNGKGGFAADGKDYIGVVAQDIEKVAPYTVNTYKAKLNANDTNETELLNFNSHALTFALINSVKELKKENDELKELVCLDHPGAAVCKSVSGA
jgi:hypothetical protein